MSKPLMPKATAVWLLDNTTLTFDQIAAFCALHPLEIQAIADGDVAMGIVGRDPIVQGILTAADIAACEADAAMRLTFVSSDVPDVQRRAKGPRYTAVTKRADKPDGIAYLVKNYPDMQDAQIARLLGTTKGTITTIRNRTHPNIANIKPTDPVILGLCTRADFDALVQKMEAAKARREKKAASAARKAAREKAAADNAPDNTATSDNNGDAPDTNGHHEAA